MENNYTAEQLELADVLDELEVGGMIELSNGDFIKRRSEYSYLLNDEKDSYGLIELHDKLKGELWNF